MNEPLEELGPLQEELSDTREAIAQLSESMGSVSDMLDMLNGHTVEVHELNRKRAEWISLLDGGPGQGFAFYIELPCESLLQPKRNLTLNEAQATVQQEQKARGEYEIKRIS